MTKPGGKRLGKQSGKGRRTAGKSHRSPKWPVRVHLDLTGEPRLSAGTDAASLTLDRFGRIGAKFGAPDDTLAYTRQVTDVASIKRTVRAIPPAGWVIIGLLLLLVIAWPQR